MYGRGTLPGRGIDLLPSLKKRLAFTGETMPTHGLLFDASRNDGEIAP
jgi:hypothetical protein